MNARSRAAVACLACAATLAFAGCGDGDGDGKAGAAAGGVEGAEKTVKSYLLALVEGDGKTGCGLLSDEYRRQIVQRNAQLASRLGASGCAEFLSKVTAKAKSEGKGVTFEGKPLRGSGDVEGLDLKTSINTNLSDREKDTAVVRSPNGVQTYDLQVVDGRWQIRAIR